MTIPAPDSESDGNRDTLSGRSPGKYLSSVYYLLDTVLGPVYSGGHIHARAAVGVRTINSATCHRQTEDVAMGAGRARVWPAVREGFDGEMTFE